MNIVCPEIYSFFDPVAKSYCKEFRPWIDGPAPNLTKKSTLAKLINRRTMSIVAAHILAHDKAATGGLVVEYQDRYPKCGYALIWDIQCNGFLYRHHAGRIYRKRVET